MNTPQTLTPAELDQIEGYASDGCAGFVMDSGDVRALVSGYREAERLRLVMSGEPVVKELHYTDDAGLEVVVDHWGVKVLAASLLDTFKTLGGENYVTTTLGSAEGKLEVTIRPCWSGKKTPAETIGELRAEVERLRHQEAEAALDYGIHPREGQSWLDAAGERLNVLRAEWGKTQDDLAAVKATRPELCDLCWTCSYAPVPPDAAGQHIVTLKDGSRAVCQLCQGNEWLRTCKADLAAMTARAEAAERLVNEFPGEGIVSVPKESRS